MNFPYYTTMILLNKWIVRTYLPILCLLSIIPFNSKGQTNISGVINQYAKVTYIGASKDKARVNGNVFSVNDKVLVIQMKGSSINTTNTSDYGAITAFNSAGLLFSL
jgi:hypothetical protein